MGWNISWSLIVSFHCLAETVKKEEFWHSDLPCQKPRFWNEPVFSLDHSLLLDKSYEARSGFVYKNVNVWWRTDHSRTSHRARYRAIKRLAFRGRPKYDNCNCSYYVQPKQIRLT